LKSNFDFLLRLSSALLSLHLHNVSVGTKEDRPDLVADSIKALQDLARTMTLSSKGSMKYDPVDFDGRTFWTHSLFAKSALIHIKYTARDEQWASDLEALKHYLRYFAPRYKIHGMRAWKMLR
jgi:hypothetical protein